MNYKLSIVIPHYNSIDLLNNLLSTIPDKDDIQVIIVDDHSSKTVKQKFFQLSEKFDKTRYLFLENLTDVHNAGAARNIALNYVKGEWLLFADADDYFLENFYDYVSKFFDNEYDLVFFRTTSIYLDTGEMADRHTSYCRLLDDYLNNPNRKNEIRIRTRWYGPIAKLIRTGIIRERGIQFDEVSIADDMFFSVQVGYYANKIAACDKTIYCITRNRGSLTTKMDLNSFETRTNIEVKINNFLRKNLSKNDFAYIGKFTAYEDLYIILQRKYGIRIFMKYIKIFAYNHMFSFSLKGLRAGMFTSFLNARKNDKEIQKKYLGQ